MDLERFIGLSTILNSNVTLFHGSNAIVENIHISKCRKYNEYGRGFYLTSDIKYAKECSLLTLDRSIVSEYTLNTQDLRYLNLTSLGPLAIIAEILTNIGANTEAEDKAIALFCEKYKVNIEDYDILEGPVADYRIEILINGFINNLLTVDEFTSLLSNINNKNNTIVLKTEKAMNELRYIKHIEIENREEYITNLKQNNNSRVGLHRFLNDRKYSLIIGKLEGLDGITFRDSLIRNFKYEASIGEYYSE